MKTVAAPAGRPGDADTGASMTPMIDIVFQLLVFFLLTLHFRSVDHRIEAALPAEGFRPEPPPLVEERPRVRVTLTAPLGADAPTRVRVGGGAAHALPGPEDTPAGRAARARVLDVVRADIAALARGQAGLGPVRGEIRTPPPGGDAVVHGDVVAVLDAFLAAGVLDVTFEARP
jgi:hypothetical protein